MALNLSEIPPAPYPFPMNISSEFGDIRWIKPSSAFLKSSEIYYQMMMVQRPAPELRGYVNTSEHADSSSPTEPELVSDSKPECASGDQEEFEVSNEWRKRLLKTAERIKNRKRRRDS